jgi:two-component system, cell cycle sensor histidine kinase and response regulator CckA
MPTDTSAVSDAVYRTLVESAPDGIVVVGQEGRIVVVNSQTEKLFGYDRAELLNKPIEILIPERFHGKHRGHRADFMSSPTVRRMGAGPEFYGVRKDGTEFPVEISLSSVQSPGGLLVSAVVRDITDRKRSEELFHGLLDSAPDAMVVVSAEGRKIEDGLHPSEASFRALVEGNYGVCRAGLDGTLLMVNQPFIELLGYASQEEVLALNLATQIFAPGEFSLSLFNPPGRHKQFTRIESRWQRRDGKLIHVELSGRLISDDTEQPVCLEILVEDVSRQRGMEQRLRHVQKMEAIGRLAGGIAHDFNNVLGVISGYCSMLMEKLESDSALYPFAAHISKAVQRGATLTRQLLAFSRQQVLQPQVIDVNAHFKGFEGLLRRVIGEDIQLSVVPRTADLHLRADPDQLEQVIMNLVVNARDAMPSGGKLTIETSELCVDAEYCIRNPDAKPGDYVLIAITDTGCGMDRATLARVFEPFFTTKEQGKGTGLGLATVYGIVKQSGGHVAVYSEPGHGTTVKILMPRSTEKAAQAKSAEGETTAPCGTEVILLVEDEESLRAVMKSYLQNKGYLVLDAGDPSEAIEVSENASQPPDLLITDVVLPQTSGVKLAQRLAALYPKMKVLYVSGYTADAIVHHGARSADFVFLSKPFSLNTLGRKVRSALDAELVSAQSAHAG